MHRIEKRSQGMCEEKERERNGQGCGNWVRKSPDRLREEQARPHRSAERREAGEMSVFSPPSSHFRPLQPPIKAERRRREGSQGRRKVSQAIVPAIPLVHRSSLSRQLSLLLRAGCGGTGSPYSVFLQTSHPYRLATHRSSRERPPGLP